MFPGNIRIFKESEPGIDIPYIIPDESFQFMLDPVRNILFFLLAIFYIIQ